MDNEDLIEKLKNKLYKAEQDFKRNAATVDHLNADNEDLTAENFKLIEELSRAKEEIERLNHKVKKVQYETEDYESLKIEKEDFENEMQIMKDQLNLHVNRIKELSRPVTNQCDSPDAGLLSNIQILKQTNEELKGKNSDLTSIIDQQTMKINTLKCYYEKEIEVLNGMNENYRQLLHAAKSEKEELENEYDNYQTNVNQPDFKRQGNSLYVEVNDRRLLAESKLLEFQEEVLRLRNTNKNLRMFLEEIFEEYRVMKDEDHRQIKQQLYEQIAELTRAKFFIESKYSTLHSSFIEKLDTHCKENTEESVAISGLSTTIDLLQKNLAFSENTIKNQNCTIDELETNVQFLKNSNMKLFKENASLMTSVADFESKLVCWEQIVPEDKKREYEEKQKEIEESLTKGIVFKECKGSNIPVQCFGKQYQDAKFQDVLLFDPFGRVIENRLTRRVMAKSKNIPLQPNIEEIIEEPVSITMLQDIEQTRLNDSKASKENIAPLQIESKIESKMTDCNVVDEKEQTPECKVS